MNDNNTLDNSVRIRKHGDKPIINFDLRIPQIQVDYCYGIQGAIESITDKKIIIELPKPKSGLFRKYRIAANIAVYLLALMAPCAFLGYNPEIRSRIQDEVYHHIVRGQKRIKKMKNPENLFIPCAFALKTGKRAGISMPDESIWVLRFDFFASTLAHSTYLPVAKVMW